MGRGDRHRAGHPPPTCARSSALLHRRTLLDWYRTDGNAAARLPLLSTYLGHVDPKSTYWYLQATPELLALAASRLEYTTVPR